MIVSNQPDISRKKMKIDELNKMNDAMKNLFHIDDIYSDMISSDLDRWKVQVCDVDADILTIAAARITTHCDTFWDGNSSVSKPWVLKCYKFLGYL